MSPAAEHYKALWRELELKHSFANARTADFVRSIMDSAWKKMTEAERSEVNRWAVGERANHGHREVVHR